jgi:hypothetical protein
VRAILWLAAVASVVTAAVLVRLLVWYDEPVPQWVWLGLLAGIAPTVLGASAVFLSARSRGEPGPPVAANAPAVMRGIGALTVALALFALIQAVRGMTVFPPSGSVGPAPGGGYVLTRGGRSTPVSELDYRTAAAAGQRLFLFVAMTFQVAAAAIFAGGRYAHRLWRSQRSS